MSTTNALTQGLAIVLLSKSLLDVHLTSSAACITAMI
jgi:hypothetical protein